MGMLRTRPRCGAQQSLQEKREADWKKRDGLGGKLRARRGGARLVTLLLGRWSANYVESAVGRQDDVMHAFKLAHRALLIHCMMVVCLFYTYT